MSVYIFKGSVIDKINKDYPENYNNNGCIICENSLFTKEITTITGNLSLSSNTGTIDFISGTVLDFTNTTFISNLVSLQDTYNNTPSDKIILNNTISTFNIKDSNIPIINNLFSVQNNAGNINYLNVNSMGIETTRLTVDNLILDLNTISNLSGNMTISPINNLLYLKNIRFIETDTQNNDIIKTNGSNILSLSTPLKHLTISDIRFLASSVSYVPVTTFRYGGSKTWNDIIKIVITVETNAAVWYIRLYDITNRNVITELNMRDRFIGYTVYEITDISNIPENEAVLQFQAHRVTTGGVPVFYSGTLYFS